MDPATRYAHDVLAGKHPAGRLVKLACERHLRDLKQAGKRGWKWDPERLEEELLFFQGLRQSKGEWAGKPLHLEPFQAFIVGSAFCWVSKTTGMRRFKTAYCELPRKNGKSTMAAGVALRLAFFDSEAGAEVFSAATKRDQAKIVWDEAKRMVRQTPDLLERITPMAHSLVRESMAQKFEPLGADEDSMDGLNMHGAIIDELHAHKTRGVWDVLETATGSRRQPLTFAITTAGWNRQTVCWEQHDYAVKVLEGVLEDDSYFAYIATIDKDDDWRDPKVWAKANPNLGVSVKAEDLERLAKRAAEMPAAQNTFLRLRLNVWTNQTERAIPADLWNRNASPPEPGGGPGYGGLDLASTEDVAAFVLGFPGSDDYLDVLARFWVPEETIVKRSRSGVPYDAWARDGWITATPGNVVDYDIIRRDIRELGEAHDIREIAVDRWNSTQITTQLEGDGFTMIPMGQGFASMSAPTKELLTRLQGGKIRHGGNPVLAWMASNLATREDAAGNLKPDRKASTEKIDGLVALIMALDRAIRQASGSVYDSRGVVFMGAEA